MSTDKKPTYEQCYICWHVDHWVPHCPKREDNFTSQQTYQHLQRSNRLSLHYLQKSLQDNVRVLNQKSNFLLSKKKVIYPMHTGVWNTLTWSGNKMTSIS